MVTRARVAPKAEQARGSLAVEIAMAGIKLWQSSLALLRPMEYDRYKKEVQLKAFIEAIEADTALQEKIRAAGNVDAVIAIAKAEGFDIKATYRFFRDIEKWGDFDI